MEPRIPSSARWIPYKPCNEWWRPGPRKLSQLATTPIGSSRSSITRRDVVVSRETGPFITPQGTIRRHTRKQMTCQLPAGLTAQKKSRSWSELPGTIEQSDRRGYGCLWPHEDGTQTHREELRPFRAKSFHVKHPAPVTPEHTCLMARSTHAALAIQLLHTPGIRAPGRGCQRKSRRRQGRRIAQRGRSRPAGSCFTWNMSQLAAPSRLKATRDPWPSGIVVEI